MIPQEHFRKIDDEQLKLVGALEGYCPVQAEGTVNAYPFYFRARWKEWAFSIAETSLMDAVDMQSFEGGEAYGFLVSGSVPGKYDASWMDYDVAEAIIKDCCRQYHQLRSA
ncbi:hypothetical protein [Hymenobacter chitinivorans]|uniref:Uncharacterized protein n=1 Tax=Hymenobacter chitinivorans DSM 11115 TaxID=1121954 RepID=A0A2M9ASD4_9BACT|nr:hypothetical protein [Hymenobacter chitinivorans]PJJ48612.1 hypothetical protein CLV45_4321 [Hymenobacter chitinivorans DSM 11115]